MSQIPAHLVNALLLQALSTGALEIVRNGNTVSLVALPKGMGIRTTVAQTKLLRETANV